MYLGKIFITISVLTVQIVFCSVSLAADPWADQVVSYQAGTNLVAGYDNAQVAIGEPSKFTPDATWGDSDVTMFSGAWKTDQVVSIGAGGHLTVKFDQAVEDDPLNPYGIDLLIFGNTGFSDSAWPDGIVGGIFNEPAVIQVSQDNNTWYTISDVFADDLWPTQGYTDTSGPYNADGTVPSDFLMPMNPSITLDSVIGLNYAQMLSLYNGSAGGTGVDISGTGLAWIQYVKIYQLETDDWSTEIDALADVAAVPEPISLAVLLLGLPALAAPKRRV